MATPMNPEPKPTTVMRKSRSLTGWAIFLVAILTGLGAAILAIRTIHQHEADIQARLEKAFARPGESTIDAVVPIRGLSEGSALTLTDVARRPIPADTAPSGVITVEEFSRYEGRRLLIPAQKGKPLVAAMFATKNSLAGYLDDRHIAMTVTVDTVNSLDNMLIPGDLVDILWVSQPPASAALPGGAAPGMGAITPVSGGGQGEAVRFLEQGVRVLTTGKSLVPNAPANGEEHYGTLTLELTPLQAQRLMLAQKNGEIRIVLRNANQNAPWSHGTLALRDILGVGRGPGGIEYIIGGSAEGGAAQVRHVIPAGDAKAGGVAPAPQPLLPGEPRTEIRYLPLPYLPSSAGQGQP